MPESNIHIDGIYSMEQKVYAMNIVRFARCSLSPLSLSFVCFFLSPIFLIVSWFHWVHGACSENQRRAGWCERDIYTIGQTKSLMTKHVNNVWGERGKRNMWKHAAKVRRASQIEAASTMNWRGGRWMGNHSVGNTCHMKSGSKKIREGRKVLKTSISCLDSFNQDKTHTHTRPRAPTNCIRESDCFCCIHSNMTSFFWLCVC